MALRRYQHETIRATFAELKKHDSTLIVMCTGGGKTRIFSSIIKYAIEKGRVMVIAHREELIRQACNEIKLVTGERPEVEMADERADERVMFKSRIIVASVQTLIRRLDKFDPNEFVLLVIDEVHHTTASNSYGRIVKHFRRNPSVKILGVTATPRRTDKKALGKVFKSCAYQYTILDAIKDGYLVDVHQEFIHVVGLDFSHLRTKGKNGDFREDELAALLETEGPLHGICNGTLQACGDRRTVVFCVSVHQAEMMCEVFNRYKPDSARWVCGETDREVRRKMFKEFSEGKFQFLTNVGVLSEGWNDPGVECIVMARPTKSSVFYTQAIGRGTRVLPDVIEGPTNDGGWWQLETADERVAAIKASAKPSMMVLDFVGVSGDHKLISAIDVLGGDFSDKVREKARKKSEDDESESSVAEDLLEAQEEVEKEEREEEARAKRRLVKGKAQIRRQVVSPFEIFNVSPPRNVSYEGRRPATDKQVALLEKHGISNASEYNLVEAKAAIDAIVQRGRNGLASYKQVRILKRWGIDGTNMSKGEAGQIIGQRLGNYRNRQKQPTA